MTNERDTQRSGQGGNPSISETFGLHQYQFTKSKWLLLAIAGLMVAVGVALTLGAGTSTSPGSEVVGADPGTVSRQSSPSDFLGSSFAESRPVSTNSGLASDEPAGSALGEFSPFFVKGGFGIFIGFAIGFAIRSFMRLATVILGFYLLALTLMAYAGWVEIHWDLMQEQFNRSVTTVGEQLSSFQAFLTGAIPATGMTALGLAFGVRKR